MRSIFAGIIDLRTTILRRSSWAAREQAPPGELTWPQVAAFGHLERDGPATGDNRAGLAKSRA